MPRLAKELRVPTPADHGPAALDAARQIKAHAPYCRVILTVYEMKRPGRDSAKLTALADHLTAHGNPSPERNPAQILSLT